MMNDRLAWACSFSKMVVLKMFAVLGHNVQRM